MNKEILWQLLVDEITAELEVMEKSVASAREGATHAESKQEGKYDTRGIEASYLAGGQQRRVEDLKSTLNYFVSMKEVMICECESASFGAVIEVENHGKKHLYFMSRLGGGIKVNYEGKDIQIITHKSPIGGEVIGLEEGDSFEIEGPKGQEELLLHKVY